MHIFLRRFFTLSLALFCLVLFLGVASSAGAQAPLPQSEAERASAFIQALGDGVLKTLSNPDRTAIDAEATFRRMLQESFDIATLGRFAIGQPWRRMTPAQRDEYTRLVHELCVRIYTDRFALYTGENFRVTGGRVADDRDVVVSSIIDRPNGQGVKTDWRVRRQADGSWRIVDVIVEGISMVLTQRAEFESVLQRHNGDVTALFGLIRTKIGQTQTATEMAAQPRANAGAPAAAAPVVDAPPSTQP